MDDFSQPRILSPGIALLRAANPSEMTLDGTNSYLLFDPSLPLAPGTVLPAGTAVMVIDPGPELEEHVQVLAGYSVELILSTHRHGDHTGGLATLVELTNAPARAFLPEFSLQAPELRDEEIIEAAGTAVRVLFTPGHTSDSVCFVRLGPSNELLTGDTVLGRGTTILDHPDGTLSDYLDSLERLAALEDMPLRPGHGPQHEHSQPLLAFYQTHRQQRLDQVRAALRKLGKAGADTEPTELLASVYPDLDPRLIGAASLSLEAQLHYLAVNP